MKKVHLINQEGFYVEDFIIEDNQKVPSDCVEVPVPDGIFLPARFENGEWVSTLSQEEINVKLNPVHEKTELEILKETVDQLVLDNLMRGF